MDLELDGRIAVVTGASKGIGLATAASLVEAGAHVVGGSRAPSPEFDELVASGRATFVQGDLSGTSGPATLVEAALDRGGVDVLVNSVGSVTPRPDGFLGITDDHWNASWSLGLLTAVRTTRAAVPAMVERGTGVIVMMGSVNAFLPDPLVLDYSVVKAALTNFAKGLSKELGPAGVRVLSVSPGPVETDLWLGKGGVADTMSDRTGMRPEEIAASAVADTPLGRFSTPREVGDLVAFLASARAANITGVDVTIDAGMITTMR
ncbi:NAD(P)-dependent dehydrogenase, short-chain alcohol dehydrogenase family [Actinacidiphila rubida]|uniref:NAD(P)-dependent dehydrogenase, short-chain alcohol dehydrogenase family n=1 Tax=Actinacidiphila rubida TaxID=310780 RepID=A0A1H8KKV2_9ACTN|nr:SDR family oxidoreductase [Actinacidiphila rubida]SEN93447.1 NAD(P)-dependent dehydrogenase, short-chain alcohol dehydrogenase family [Actinacidiphila rubida]